MEINSEHRSFIGLSNMAEKIPTHALSCMISTLVALHVIILFNCITSNIVGVGIDQLIDVFRNFAKAPNKLKEEDS